jgi:acetyltransferase-like isoleucine patch superfamily enzyme
MAARSHGTGEYLPEQLGSLGEATVIEEGVLIFNPGYVHVGRDVYVGHRAMLIGDTRAELRIGDGSWIGQDVYMQSAGGIRIGRRVGIGPRVMILTSTHRETPFPAAIIDAPLEFAPVQIEDGCDIGLGVILLPGCCIRSGAQIGAGSVVLGEIPPGAIALGTPARVRRKRDGAPTVTAVNG